MRYAIVGLFLLAACGDSPMGPNATPFDPPAIYRSWWVELEACSGLSGSIDGVRFYSAASLGGELGHWYQDGNRIYLLESRTETEFAVKHEMMHALLQRGDHPPEYFAADRCGSLWF